MITKFKLFETIKNLPDTFYKWFGKSKVVDINGEPLIVYHGSSEIFSEFDPKTFGKHATAEGFGFYFTDSKNVASRYIDNGKLYDVYLRICKPLNYTRKTITRPNLVKFIKALDLAGADYLSNFGDVEYDGYNTVLRLAISETYDSCDTDVEIIHSIINAVGSDFIFGYKILYDTLKYDGTIVTNPNWGDDIEKQTIYIVFNSNQIKSATDNNGDFSLTKNNIYE